ncbi:hypothetical protein [Bacillus mobilis]|uniref:hypothetical protein n=1 Tax=Bacillus mobilis TaxID=2026190 RepID=UPI0036C78E3C
MNMTKDTERRNKPGAIIHDTINDFEYLNIPMILKKEDSPVYEVLSVRTAGKDDVAAVSMDRITMSRTVIQVATIKDSDGSIQAYRLPLELKNGFNTV